MWHGVRAARACMRDAAGIDDRRLCRRRQFGEFFKVHDIPERRAFGGWGRKKKKGQIAPKKAKSGQKNCTKMCEKN